MLANIQSLLALLASAALCAVPAAAQSTTRVSLDSAGAQGSGRSARIQLSADARLAGFVSKASNLVPNDTNQAWDVFVRDRLTGTTSRVSVDSFGAEGNADSLTVSISHDGRFVAFSSVASNLVPGDLNGEKDVFVHDRQTGRTRRVSVSTLGVEGNRRSEDSSISMDGRFVAFTSTASNLVPNDTNGSHDVFVHDLHTGLTTRVSVASTGAEGNELSVEPAISSDGRLVAFWSWAENLVPGDTNLQRDVFLHDCQTAQTRRVSVDSLGAEGDRGSAYPAVSADGHFVSFWSEASTLVPGDTNGDSDIFVHDVQTGETSRVSVDSAGRQANKDNHLSSISADGQFVAFQSRASNLVLADNNSEYDIFVHDRLLRQTTRVSVDSMGMEQLDGYCARPFISPDGRLVGFESDASVLVPGDTNDCLDVFVRDLGVPPALHTSGACPGNVRLTITGGHSGGRITLAAGPAGRQPKQTPPCSWVVLSLNRPLAGTIQTADASGTVVIHFFAPPSLCGLQIQALDVQSCLLSNVITL